MVACGWEDEEEEPISSSGYSAPEHEELVTAAKDDSNGFLDRVTAGWRTRGAFPLASLKHRCCPEERDNR